MIELTTTRAEEARLAEPRPPRVVRVRPVERPDRTRRYYLDGWPWPVPATLRRLDGVRVRTLALAVLAAGAGAWWLWRLLGTGR